MSQNPVLPTLYKINNKKKIRKWNICIVNDDDKSYKIITTFGDIAVTKNNEIQEIPGAGKMTVSTSPSI